MKLTKLIYSSILKLACISLFCLAPINTLAQEKPKIIENKGDSIHLFRGLAIGGDLVGFLQTLVSTYGQYETTLRLNLKDKYFPVIEIGLGKAEASDDATNLVYKTKAPYSKIGIDFNMMKNKHDIYRIYTGVRYAFTSFKYDVTGPEVIDPIWHDRIDFNTISQKCTYHWAELVVGIDAQIWKAFRMGWSLRYRRRIAHKESETGNAWYVPGFGKSNGSNIGGTFNLTFEL